MLRQRRERQRGRQAEVDPHTHTHTHTQGSQMRSTSTTGMNEQSSRSHAILQMTLRNPSNKLHGQVDSGQRFLSVCICVFMCAGGCLSMCV